MVDRTPLPDWSDIIAKRDAEIARLRAGGCARDQGTTQYCAEAARLAAENGRLTVENIQMRFALGYPMPADLERHILPNNPFKCGVCDARAAITEEPANGL